MKYEVVEMPEKKIVCLKTHTGNGDADCQKKIAELWERLMCGNECEKLKLKDGAAVYGVYTNYKWDDQSYDALAGCESTELPEGFEEITIRAGSYAKFTVHGDVRKSVAEVWDEIWSMQLPRAFSTDFEEYVSCDENMCGEINLYVALADICQSCGMPMVKHEEYGTEADGSESRKYCTYCFQKGCFTRDCTMEEMVETNIMYAPEIYKDAEASRKFLREYLPTLERWKQQK